METTHYQILDIDVTATAEDIKSAYRRLAIKYHPDKQSTGYDSAERFLQLQQSYEVLSNPGSRARYDREIAEAYKLRASTPKPKSSSQNRPHVVPNTTSPPKQTRETIEPKSQSRTKASFPRGRAKYPVIPSSVIYSITLGIIAIAIPPLVILLSVEDGVVILLPMFVGLVAGIVSVMFGHIATSSIDGSRGLLTGMRLARVALGMGYSASLIYLVGLILATALGVSE